MSGAEEAPNELGNLPATRLLSTALYCTGGTSKKKTTTEKACYLRNVQTFEKKTEQNLHLICD